MIIGDHLHHHRVQFKRQGMPVFASCSGFSASPYLCQGCVRYLRLLHRSRYHFSWNTSPTFSAQLSQETQQTDLRTARNLVVRPKAQIRLLQQKYGRNSNETSRRFHTGRIQYDPNSIPPAVRDSAVSQTNISSSEQSSDISRSRLSRRGRDQYGERARGAPARLARRRAPADEAGQAGQE